MNVQSILSILYILSAVRLRSVHSCEIYRFVASKGPQILEGHVIKTVMKPLVNFCWGDCVWLPWCFSINVRQTSEGTFECELNNSSKKANPHKMVTREGWSYHEMTNVSGVDCNFNDCKRKEDLGNGWRRYGDAATKLFTEKKTWSDARSHCQSLGGDLLSITSSHENDFVNEVFVKQLNLTYTKGDYPNFGVPYEAWKLNQSEPTVQLKGTPGDVLYKPVDGDTALYFTGRQGYAHIPAVNVNPEGFTIAFWLKILHRTPGQWIHPFMLVNQPLVFYSPSKIVDFYFNSGKTQLNVRITSHDRGKATIFEYNKWIHLAVSGNKSTGLWHYVIDGRKRTTWSSMAFPSITGNENIVLGVKSSTALTSSQTLHGYIKDIMVINKSLDIHKIQTITFWNEHGSWIGLHDQAETGRFSWSDGTPVQFLAFPRKPEPALSGRKCTILGKNGEWLDKLCSMEYPFICEKRMNGY